MKMQKLYRFFEDYNKMPFEQYANVMVRNIKTISTELDFQVIVQIKYFSKVLYIKRQIIKEPPMQKSVISFISDKVIQQLCEVYRENIRKW